MDPLTHIVVGRAVVAAADSGDRPGRGVAAAAILGALSPDVDAATVFIGWDRYVRIHEIGTHSIAGAVLMACLTAVVVRAVSRLRDANGFGDLTRSGGAESVALRLPTPGFSALVAAAAAGAMSHLILDVVCGGRIRPGWPLVNDRVTVPLVAMADPWFIAIGVAGFLALWPGRQPLRIVSRTVVGASIVFLGVKGALLARALHASHLDARLTAIEARWGSLTEWSLFERKGDSLRAWKISSSGEPPMIFMSHASGGGPKQPLVQASRSLDTVRNFLSVHDFTFPSVRPADGGPGVDVLWSDLRYCWPLAAAADDARPSAHPPPEDAIGCGVWAGGAFAADGRALRQVVMIGSVVQTRPPPR